MYDAMYIYYFTGKPNRRQNPSISPSPIFLRIPLLLNARSDGHLSPIVVRRHWSLLRSVAPRNSHGPVGNFSLTTQIFAAGLTVPGDCLLQRDNLDLNCKDWNCDPWQHPILAGLRKAQKVRDV
jgi:hypothetical protein